MTPRRYPRDPQGTHKMHKGTPKDHHGIPWMPECDSGEKQSVRWPPLFPNIAPFPLSLCSIVKKVMRKTTRVPGSAWKLGSMSLDQELRNCRLGDISANPRVPGSTVAGYGKGMPSCTCTRVCPCTPICTWVQCDAHERVHVHAYF